jgi:hypothetical protein
LGARDGEPFFVAVNCLFKFKFESRLFCIVKVKCDWVVLVNAVVGFNRERSVVEVLDVIRKWHDKLAIVCNRLHIQLLP